MKSTRAFFAQLIEAFPLLPYLALGAWLAAVYLASSGTAWLSDTEMNGENISILFSTSSLASAAVMLVATFFAPRAHQALCKPSASLAAGAVAGLGNLLIILIGPYYLNFLFTSQMVMVLFVLGGVLFGAGLGVVGLRCAQLYGALSALQIIAYSAFSQVFVALTFFIVVGSPDWAPIPGGPSLAGIIAFVGLPLLAGVLASLSTFFKQRGECFDGASALTGSANRGESEIRDSTSRASLPKAFWKFLAVVLVFSFITSSIHAEVVGLSPVDDTLNGSRFVMLLRMLLAVVLACIAVGTSGSKLNFGKIYSVVMVASVALVAALPIVLTPFPPLLQVISFAMVVFELFLWCILAFIVYQRRISAVIVFGFGYGAYLFGRGLGWLVGSQALLFLIDAIGDSFAYMTLALIVLACAFLIFSEREFDELFAVEGDDVPSLDEMLSKDFVAGTSDEGSAEGEEGDAHLNRKGRFSQAVEELAHTHQLSPRETDVLRCLAMGYNSSTTADKLSISWNTVRTHTRNVYNKLDVHSHQELISLVDDAIESLEG